MTTFFRKGLWGICSLTLFFSGCDFNSTSGVVINKSGFAAAITTPSPTPSSSAPPALLPPSSVAYSSNPATYKVATAIAVNSPATTGGNPTSFSITPSLPIGLLLNSTTGVLSGTPSTMSAATNYTVVASNAAGSAQTTLNISVITNVLAPTNLSYSNLAPVFTNGTAITNLTPTNQGGTPTSYSISPSLSAGLVFNATTGVISGTPTAVQVMTPYRVTAMNAGGSASNTLSITVTPVSSGTGSIGHGNGPTITTFKPSGPVTAKSGQTISGLSISNPNGPCISVANVTNVTIVNNKIGPCGPTTSGVGIDLSNSDHITVQNNSISDVASGMYVVESTGGSIIFSNNYVTKVRGPYPRGQMIQYNTVSGSGNKITCNVSDQALGGYRDSSGGYMGPEDHVNLYMTNGTSSSPVEVAYNKIRGGGSVSGGGLMTGDSGSSSYQYVHDNILVNPGQYGIAIAGGQYIQLINNRVYAAKNSWANIGAYVWAQGGASCGNSTFQSNRINYTNASGVQNPYWNGGGCGTVNFSGNTLPDLTVTASIWDEVILQCQ